MYMGLGSEAMDATAKANRMDVKIVITLVR